MAIHCVPPVNMTFEDRYILLTWMISALCEAAIESTGQLQKQMMRVGARTDTNDGTMNVDCLPIYRVDVLL